MNSLSAIMYQCTVSLLCLAFVSQSPERTGADSAKSPPVAKKAEKAPLHTLSLHAASLLSDCEPLDVTLVAKQPGGTSSRVRLAWTGPYKNVTLELKTTSGESVPLFGVLRRWGGTDQSTHLDIRLRPIGSNSKVVSFSPGEYQLKAVVEPFRDPFDPLRFTGRVEAGPVSIIVRKEKKLPPDEIRRLIAELNHRDPSIREKAIVRVPSTTDEDLLTTVVAMLADPHVVQNPLSTDVSLTRPVASVARVTILPAQGSAVIDPLLAFASKPENSAYRGSVAEVLGNLGYDKRSAAFLIELTNKGSHDERCFAVASLGRLGPETVAELIRIARESKQNEIIRRLAIEETAHFGTVETVGPFLCDALKYSDEQHRCAAADAIGTLGVRTALPNLKRIATDEQEGFNARNSAIRAYVAIASPADAQSFLRGLLKSKNDNVRILVKTGLDGVNRKKS